MRSRRRRSRLRYEAKILPYLFLATFVDYLKGRQQSSQRKAPCSVENNSVTIPWFCATIAAKPSMTGNRPTNASRAFICRCLSCVAISPANSYRSIVETFPWTSRLLTRILLTFFSAAVSQSCLKRRTASSSEKAPLRVACNTSPRNSKAICRVIGADIISEHLGREPLCLADRPILPYKQATTRPREREHAQEHLAGSLRAASL
jgi:hypothetical protein